MAQQENKITFTKIGKREVSPFIGHELLYDYLCGNLDDARKVSVEEHLRTSRDAQLDYAKIQMGQDYVERLAQTIVSQPIISQIISPTTYAATVLRRLKFDKWPQGFKWGIEAVVGVVILVAVLSVTPWQKIAQLGTNFSSKDLVLAEISKTNSKNSSEEIRMVEKDHAEFIDEGVKANRSDVNMAANTAGSEEKPVIDKKPVASRNVNMVSTTGDNAVNDKSTDSAAAGGFLYRGQISVSNLEMTAPKMTEKIGELGGRKAGSVELGWAKTEKSRYYHFTVPEAKYQDLVSFMEPYGKLRISKEKHPRTMPDGIIRLIITVDEANQ